MIIVISEFTTTVTTTSEGADVIIGDENITICVED